MATGQQYWGNAGDTTNAYVVRPGLHTELYYESVARTFWGKVNGMRTVTVNNIEGTKGAKVEVDSGNSSIVWEKDRGTGTNEIRFSLRERKRGNATYGEAPVKPGHFSEYKHSNVYVIQTDSPEYPIVGLESEMQVSEVVPNLVEAEKADITYWGGQEMDLDGWRGYFLGASRGLLSTEDGGMGIKLPGSTTAGLYRAPYWNFFANASGLSTPAYAVATHNATVATGIKALIDNDNKNRAFNYESHRIASRIVDDLNMNPVKWGSREYRAICAIDRDLLHRLRSQAGTGHTGTGSLNALFKDAAERARTNPALYYMDALELDDILYVPLRQLEYFRPTSADDVNITWGAGLDKDPRTASFSNTSKVCAAVYLGAGAMLRGVRRRMWWTTKEGDHEKSRAYAMHYYDGWKRHDWVAQDGREAISNDSSFVFWARDNGPGQAFAA
jgi:hypothetical protein